MSPLIPMRRRIRSTAPALSAAAVLVLALLSPAVAAERAQREMQIHKVAELGLEIWVENQPPWEAEVMKAVTRPSFVVQSPADYYPPAVMTYVSLPGAAVAEGALLGVATSAIRRAAENYRMAAAAGITLQPRPARYGEFGGYEAEFDGWANGEAVAVKVFVGQAPGRFPVAMQAYTLRGQLPQLAEQTRRAWGRVKYLR